MGFAHKRVWTMGYCGPMGYGMHFSANQVGGQPELWAMRGYVFSEVWFTRGSTVQQTGIMIDRQRMEMMNDRGNRPNLTTCCNLIVAYLQNIYISFCF